MLQETYQSKEFVDDLTNLKCFYYFTFQYWDE